MSLQAIVQIEFSSLDVDLHERASYEVDHELHSRVKAIIEQDDSFLRIVRLVRCMSPMANLDFKDLRHFWIVAKCGSFAAASKQLHLTPQSISGQLRELEEYLGIDLFQRTRRSLAVTETEQRMLPRRRSGGRFGRYLRTLRGNIQTPSLTNSSLMMRTSPTRRRLWPCAASVGAARVQSVGILAAICSAVAGTISRATSGH